MKRFRYFKPRSLDEVWKLKEKLPEARFIAGGTDLLVQIKNGEIRPPALISLRSVPNLSILDINKGARIGALTTINELIQHQDLLENFPLIGEAARCLGSIQIRNVATVGGNLCNCSPCADMALPLLALEAKVRLQSVQGARTVPLTEFFTGPGQSCRASEEIMTDILLDPPSKKAKTIFWKKGRVKMDLAVASLAALLEMDGTRFRRARLAAGSVAPIPLRLTKVEKLLEGAVISRELVSKAQKLAAESVFPITDIRATEEYRRHIVSIFVKRSLENLLGWSQT
jgi:carbon-monoxide dehydrogenase medium subunit